MFCSIFETRKCIWCCANVYAALSYRYESDIQMRMMRLSHLDMIVYNCMYMYDAFSFRYDCI